jgi:omega-amidase
MSVTQLNISIIQPDIVWEDKTANLEQYAAYIEQIQEKKEVVILPEMFSTGFSMRPEALAETMEGESVQWMKDMAKKHRCIITGSLIIEDDGKYFNRLLWVQPDGKIGQYDKRHLFAFADEHNHYSPGERRFIAQVKGFRICLQVCFTICDSRFGPATRAMNMTCWYTWPTGLNGAAWPGRHCCRRGRSRTRAM